MISRISRAYQIEAAHWLPNVPDDHKCRRMHGHNYRVVVTFVDNVDDRGFVKDYAEIDELMAPWLKELDHSCLNDTISNPTAENIAQWLLYRMPDATCVRVYENSDCWAEATQ